MVLLCGGLSLVIWLAIQPRHLVGEVAIAVANYTNGIATFTITNLNSFSIEFMVQLERKATNGWPDYFKNGILPHSPPSTPEGVSSRGTPVLKPLRTFTFSLPIETENPPSPWRLSAVFSKEWNSLNDLKQHTGEFLDRLNMPAVSGWFLQEPDSVLTEGPEMQQ
jgi:hypothetical protein